MPLQAVAAADDIRLTLRQPLRHQPPHQYAVILVLQVLQHGVTLSHHVANGQVAAVAVSLNGIAEGHLPLQLPLGAEVHEDLV